VPLIVGLLVSLISGVVCLLLHMITLAVILGYTFASMLMVVSTEKGKCGRMNGFSANNCAMEKRVHAADERADSNPALLSTHFPFSYFLFLFCVLYPD